MTDNSLTRVLAGVGVLAIAASLIAVMVSYSVGLVFSVFVVAVVFGAVAYARQRGLPTK